MNVIPKKDFIRKIIVNAIRTHCKHCGTYQKRLRQCILKIPKVRNIVQDVNGDKNYRMILLNENVTLTKDQNEFIASIGGEIETNYELKLDTLGPDASSVVITISSNTNNWFNCRKL